MRVRRPVRRRPGSRAAVVQAGAVVVRRDGRSPRFLVIRSSDDLHWLFPKGHVEAGETPRRAAARELREEAGVDGEVGALIGRERYALGRRTVEVTYYLAEYRGDVLPDEARETRWCTAGRARRLLSFDELRLVLDRAVALL
jgi:8-oxo-dGTP pyrophosphatase MutT (NUDIX family)